MSVFTATQQWSKGKKISYDIVADNGMNAQNVNQWINNFNESLTYPLLTRKKVGKSQFEPYVLFKYKNTDAGHAKIGRPQAGKTEVEFNAEKKFFHELLHALGFNHEQYHKKYLWNQNDPFLNSTDLERNTMYSFKGKSTTIQNQLRYKILVENYGNQYGADAQLRQLYLVVNIQDWLFSEDIDAESIMMYESSATGIVEGFIERTTPSNRDLETIRLYYPSPVS